MVVNYRCVHLSNTFREELPALKVTKMRAWELTLNLRPQGYNSCVSFPVFSKTGLMLYYYSVLVLSNSGKWSLQLDCAEIWHLTHVRVTTDAYTEARKEKKDGDGTMLMDGLKFSLQNTQEHKLAYDLMGKWWPSMDLMNHLKTLVTGYTAQ